MKKIIIYLATVAAALSLLALSACSSGSGNNTNPSSSSAQSEERQGIYQHLQQAKNEIWYVTDEVGKDSYPEYIYIFNKGKVKGYTLYQPSEGKSFGDLAKMTDEEIIDYYEGQEGTALQNYYEKMTALAEKSPDDEDYKKLLEALTPYNDGSGKLPEVDFSAKFIMDDTGNSPVSEDLEIDIFDIGKPDNDVGNFWNYTLKLRYPTSTMNVYNSTYNGFETEDEVRPLFITRSKHQFNLDKEGIKGIEVE